MAKQEKDLQNPHPMNNTDRYSPNISMPDLEEIEDITDGRLHSFEYHFTPVKELPFYKFTSRQLTVRSDQKSWIFYRWKTSTRDKEKMQTETSMATTGKETK